MNWQDFAVGAYSGFLVGFVSGAVTMIIKIIWKEKWTPPASLSPPIENVQRFEIKPK
jgi:hypothetical protein